MDYYLNGVMIITNAHQSLRSFTGPDCESFFSNFRTLKANLIARILFRTIEGLLGASVKS